jgi:exosortase E/protease (VPEID-CTERM system)
VAPPARRAADARPSLPDAAAAQLAPLLVTLAAALATGAVAAGPLDRLYGVRALAGAAAVLLVRRALPRPSLALAPWPLALGAAVGVVWCLAPGGDGAALGTALRALAPAEQAAWIGARLLGSVLVVPLVEELAFRGFLLPWLAAPSAGSEDPALPARRWTWSSVLLSSAAFGALHGSFLLGTAAGIAFAYARARRGRLSDAVVAHVVANAVVALAVLALGRWDLWA